MPPANKSVLLPSDPLRILGYGDTKTKKTWWALMAAAAGWRVVLLDADKGSKIIKQIGLSPEALARVSVINIADTAFSPTATVFMAQALTEKVVWNEQEKRILPPLHQPSPDCSHYILDLRKLGPETLLVVDTWTSIIKSMEWNFNIRNEIDPRDAEKIEWPGYGHMGRNATWMIKKLKSLNCHVMVISHKTLYEKRTTTKVRGSDGKMHNETKVEFQRVQPVSSSGPHGMTLGADFDECYIFERRSEKSFMIDLAGDKDKDAGSRSIKPQQYKWEDLQFEKVAKINNLSPPTAEQIAENDAIQWHDVGESFVTGAAANKPRIKQEGGKTVITGGKSDKKASLNSLFAK